MPNPSTYSAAAHAEKILARFCSAPLPAVAITDVKKNWDAVEKKVHRKPMVITRKGETAAILISTKDYRKLMDALIEMQEDIEDIAAVAAHDPKDDIPFDDFVAELKRDGKL